MRYLIDGYNLAFKLYSSKHTLQQKRTLSITELSEKITTLKIDAAIIFDAQYTQDERSRNHFAGLEVHFTAHNETADEWILNSLTEEKTPSKVTVVTSDRDLLYRSRRYGAHAITIETFVNWLDKRFINSSLKLKRSHKVLVPPTPLSKPPPPEKKILKSTPAEECLDYYLDAFSVNLPDAEALPKKIPKLKKKIHPEAVPSAAKIEETLFEFYLKSFENKT